MTTADSPLVNPRTGDRLWFESLPVAALDPVVFRCEIPAASPGAPLHYHRVVDERFECLAGELSMVVAGRALTLAPGQSVDVPRGVAHRFWNASSQPAAFRSVATPGVDFERFLRVVYGLGRDNRVGRSGMPSNPLEVAVIRELADLYFVGPPRVVQSAIFAAMSSLARATGVRARLSSYWTQRSPEGAP